MKVFKLKRKIQMERVKLFANHTQTLAKENTDPQIATFRFVRLLIHGVQTCRVGCKHRGMGTTGSDLFSVTCGWEGGTVDRLQLFSIIAEALEPNGGSRPQGNSLLSVTESTSVTPNVAHRWPSVGTGSIS
jgi:hypothetical protein